MTPTAAKAVRPGIDGMKVGRVVSSTLSTPICAFRRVPARRAPGSAHERDAVRSKTAKPETNSSSRLATPLPSRSRKP